MLLDTLFALVESTAIATMLGRGGGLLCAQVMCIHNVLPNLDNMVQVGPCSVWVRAPCNHGAAKRIRLESVATNCAHSPGTRPRVERPAIRRAYVLYVQ